MEEKIKLVEARISELEELIYKAANGKSYADIRWLNGLLALNQRMLILMKEEVPIHFLKLEEPKDPPLRAGFFLTSIQVLDPFINVLN